MYFVAVIDPPVVQEVPISVSSIEKREDVFCAFRRPKMARNPIVSVNRIFIVLYCFRASPVCFHVMGNSGDRVNKDRSKNENKENKKGINPT